MLFWPWASPKLMLLIFFTFFFTLHLHLVIWQTLLSKATYNWFIFNKSFKLMCCFGDLLAVAGIPLTSLVCVSPFFQISTWNLDWTCSKRKIKVVSPSWHMARDTKSTWSPALNLDCIVLLVSHWNVRNLCFQMLNKVFLQYHVSCRWQNSNFWVNCPFDYKSIAIVINDSPVFVLFFSHVSENVLNLDCFTVKFIFVTTNWCNTNIVQVPAHVLFCFFLPVAV